MLERAINRVDGNYAIEDIQDELSERNMQLWAWLDGDTIKAACVTQINMFPRRKVCVILLAGGECMVDWLECGTINEWAKENGCQFVECTGRKGWKRALKGWREVGITLRKEI